MDKNSNHVISCIDDAPEVYSSHINGGEINERMAYLSSYKEATGSQSITVSPSNNFALLEQLKSCIQKFTNKAKHPIFSNEDADKKAPLLSTRDNPPSLRSLTPLEEQTTDKCSVTQTVFNGFCLFVGIGLFSVPSTIQQGGWASLGIFILYAGLCYVTAYMLGRCFQSETRQQITSFTKLGEVAFQRAGRIIFSVIFYTEVYFCCVEFILLESDNLAKLLPNASIQWGAIYLTPVHFMGIVATVIVLPTSYIWNDRYISYISAGGLIGSLCMALSLLLVGVVEDIGFHQTGPLVKWTGLPYALGVFGFCYSGHSVLPHLYNKMSDKEKFNKAMTIIFVICTSLYLVVAIMGFLMFGNDTNSQITLNLPANSLASTIALIMTVASPLFKYTMLLNPLAVDLEKYLLKEKSISYWYTIPLRTALVVTSVLVAFLVPYFGYVMAFTGSLMCLLASVVLPALCYVKMVENVSSLQKNLCYTVAVIGLIVAVFGTYSSVYDIILQY